jgi:hypothetical protein
MRGRYCTASIVSVAIFQNSGQSIFEEFAIKECLLYKMLNFCGSLVEDLCFWKSCID